VWQKAHLMMLETYAVCQTFPPEGDGVLGDHQRFLLHALGSLNEVEYDLLLARDLRVLPVTEHLRLCRLLEEVRRMLSGLVAQLKA
jgi:four helix bundle protein